MIITQFSDIHLFENPAGSLLNVKTDDSFRYVARQAREDQWPPDMVLVTGDLSQDGSPASYQRLGAYLNELNVPVYCLPGNHDLQTVMKRTLNFPRVHQRKQVLYKNWNIILLDSTVPGKNGGHFRATELTFLKKCLKKYPKHHTLITFHHNPVAIGSAWLDTMIISNASTLMGIVDKHKQVRGILFGHVHQSFFGKRKGVSFIGSPSTCVQFKPKRAQFKLDAAAPGYRWIRLHPSGRIQTRVMRIKNSPFKPDMSSRGY